MFVMTKPRSERSGAVMTMRRRRITKRFALAPWIQGAWIRFPNPSSVVVKYFLLQHFSHKDTLAFYIIH